jgi:hypothetical protein
LRAGDEERRRILEPLFDHVARVDKTTCIAAVILLHSVESFLQQVQITRITEPLPRLINPLHKKYELKRMN